MANKIEMFYSSFAGIDTRSNKLLQNPKSFRKGSKNFRYSFQDEITNRQGFQRKDSGAPNFVDIFEYKYRDVNTGAALTQNLGVATDGHLYKMRTESLRFNSTTGYTSVSVYFDDIANTFKLVLDAASPQTINISDTMTLKQLEDALDAIPGISVSIVDDLGVAVPSSTKLAYLLDCVINDTTFADNSVYYWTQIPHPEISCASASSVTEANLDLSNASQWTMDAVPFKTTLKAQTDASVAASYEGISSINLNNSIYITDGGFPMKYDGKCVYRAGVPHTIEIPSTNKMTSVFERNNYDCSGITTKWEAPGAGYPTLASTTYSYKFRYGFTDYNGGTYYGDIAEYPFQPFEYPLPIPDVGTQAPNYSIKIAQKALVNAKDFPIFSAKISGTQYSTTGLALTLNVASGHNILPGMVVRQTSQKYSGPFGIASFPENTGSSYISFYAKVISVTSTTITLEKVVYDSIAEGSYSRFVDGSIINAYYVNDFISNKRPATTFANLEVTPAGFFLEIYRTKANQQNTGPFYRVYSMPVTTNGLYAESSIYDGKPDDQLSEQLTDQELGGEIPRACKYLTGCQNQLIQSGYTPDKVLAQNKYPSFVQFPLVVPYAGQPATRYTGVKLGQTGYDEISIYGESFLCDFQSVYWADALTTEGFPQDGLHEIAIDTKVADRVTGIAQNKDSLFALKERSTAIVSGSLAQNDVVLEILESDSGCSSHKSIQEIKGNLIWLDGINGFYSCVAGRLPENIGFPIQDYQKINELGLDYSKAAACNFRKESLYICSVQGTTFVFDYADNGNKARSCWYIWDGFTGKSLLATSTNKLLMWNGTNTLKMKLTKTKYDFSDHKSAIPMILNTAWLTQGHPTIDKHYLGLWINSIQGDFTLNVKQYGNFLEDLIGTQTNIYFLPEGSDKKFIKAQMKASLPKLSAISFGMENSEINTAVKIQGYEVQYSADFAVGEPKR